MLCGLTWDALGIIEFVKLANKADIGPIYYCEVINLCPSKRQLCSCFWWASHFFSVNDNGDATFKEYTILPPRAPIGTKFAIDFAHESENGTGTGELYIEIDCVNKIKLYSRLLNEALKPGTYGARLALDATPDPDCDPSEGERQNIGWFSVK